MSTLSTLIEKMLASPRWGVTRDVIARQPESLVDSFEAIRDDLSLLNEHIEALKRNPSERGWIDVRIATEHLLLLTARVLPAVEAALADLYMTMIADREDESAQHAIPTTLGERQTELGRLTKRFGEVSNASHGVDDTQPLLDFVVIVAEINTACARLLRDVLQAS